MVRRHLIILGVFSLLNCAVHSQPSWRADKLGVEDGLSEGNIYVIHQDKRGFIWIGTHGGLNRYDGYGFKLFHYSPFDSSTLGDNAVFFLKPDLVSGKFWIGGSSCLNEFDPETFTNTRYRYAKKQLEFADGVFVNSHEMLLACENEVLLFDTKTKTFQEIPTHDENNNPVSITRVENAATDKQGNFMIMSRTGVFFYDPGTKTCKRKTTRSPDFSAFNQYEIFNVIQDKHGDYWIATNKKGLIRYASSSKRITTVKLPPPFKNETVRFDVVTEDSSGNIWAGGSRGTFRIDPATLQPEYFSSDIDDNGLPSPPEINVVMEDRNHFMWLGTVGDGIYKMIPTNSGFRNYVLAQNNTDAKTGTYVMAIQQMGNDIWFVNIWDQVGKVNMKNGETTLLRRPLLSDDYSWYSEGSIINKDGNLILLNGESRYDISQDQAGEIFVQSQATPGLSHIYQALNSKTWYMVKAAVEKTFCRNDTIFGNQFFYDAKEDNKGNIWIGSSRGLIKFSPAQNLIVQYQHDDNDNNSISSDFVYSLEIDHQNIWMATYNGGLCSFNTASGTFRNYDKEDGLSDNTVYSLEKDDHGNIWFSSNAGISEYNAATKTFRNYGVQDGLLNQEFNRRSSFKNESGWLFFGGVSGIDYFHPDSIVKNNISPTLTFTNFRIFNKDYIPDTKKSLPVIELKPNDVHITIEFASLNYNDRQKIQYAYRVNNDEWVKMGNQHVLSFSDLGPGNQHLYVRSTNSEGIWLNNEIACLIIVHPWWWETFWFRIGIGAIAIGLLFASTRFYYRRKLEKQKIILEKQQLIEKERTRIATDMHDDLGADLSRIKFLSETVSIKKQKQEPIEDEISSIRHYAHEMIDKMGDIVWALNEKNDSLGDLLAYTRSYAVTYLSQNGVETHVETTEQLPNVFVSGEFRRNVYLTVKEALHNVVKHSQANKVDICVQAGKQLSISIHDNGKGFEEKDIRPFSNGINNMRKRIVDLGGHVQIKNTEGSTIILVVPLP